MLLSDKLVNDNERDHVEYGDDEPCLPGDENRSCHNNYRNHNKTALNPNMFTLWSVNILHSNKRVDALAAEIKKRITGDSEGQVPLIIAVQDMYYKQAFYGIPGYNLWYSVDGTFTEDGYKLTSLEGIWRVTIAKSLTSLRYAKQAVLNALKVLLDLQELCSTIIDKLKDAYKDLACIEDIGFKKCKDTIADARSSLLVTKPTIIRAMAIIDGAKDKGLDNGNTLGNASTALKNA
ncbi:hypothetical protein ACHAQK_002664 [Fusarium lateritium]